MSRAPAFFSFSMLLSICGASFAQAVPDHYGVGSPGVFIEKYREFRAERIRSAETSVLRIDLGHVKGLSRSFVGAAGDITIDLATGRYTATLRGLGATEVYSLWLMDRPEPGAGFAPRFNDARTLKLADVRGTSGTVSGVLGGRVPADFSLDRINLLRGSSSSGEVVASGSTNVFQKIFFRRLEATTAGRSLALPQIAEPRPAFAWLVPDLAIETLTANDTTTSSLAATAAPSASPAAVPLDTLISQGATLFFDGQFAGNGRTCGTCHPRSNNLTIDVAFIASLPANDPLFVAELNPALAQLERPALMRQFGLILENLDGLDDPTNKFVMRSVPHTLGLQTSLQRDITTLPNAPAQMTGWSGDGAPGAGSLRDFAVGAVTQHFTKSLARNEGPDFNLPSEHQLDAMEAFQLSLGRTADFNLASVVFTDANVETGKALFINGTGNPAAGGQCGACHSNGGALIANGQNLNFNTNIEDAVNPARAVETFPIDGGFGLTPNPDGSFGNRGFNAPPVVEAADTAPFFHNNIAGTLEDVVAFYMSPEFNGPRLPAAQFNFNATQIAQLTDFMRALNTLQNIQVARRELQEILSLNGNPQNEIQTRLQTAGFDTDDAIAVLNQGAIYPAVVVGLTAARSNITLAQQTNNPALRNTRIQTAITQLSQANTAIAP
jgi:cytochrome c peroxidase